MQKIPEAFQEEPWARLPQVGHKKGVPGGRLRGLSRTTLLELNDAGLIKVIAVRKPGALKAIRLVFLPSLDSYLQGLATEVVNPQTGLSSEQPIKKVAIAKKKGALAK